MSDKGELKKWVTSFMDGSKALLSILTFLAQRDFMFFFETDSTTYIRRSQSIVSYVGVKE